MFGDAVKAFVTYILQRNPILVYAETAGKARYAIYKAMINADYRVRLTQIDVRRFRDADGKELVHGEKIKPGFCYELRGAFT
jgi:hypothetical protein